MFLLRLLSRTFLFWLDSLFACWFQSELTSQPTVFSFHNKLAPAGLISLETNQRTGSEILTVLLKTAGQRVTGSLIFKRALSSRDFDRWMDLKSILSATTLTHNIDSVSWALDKSGHFTTKSLYRFLTDRGITSKVAGYIWKCKVPL